MAAFGWSLLAVLIGLFAQSKCSSTVFPVIPAHLLDCYINEGIYHRANRMPSTFGSFVDLLRKVEESPTSKNLNAREMSLALLQYLKLDGIQTIQSHTSHFSSNILPFAPSGPEYFKHRLTLIGLLPKIDYSYTRAFNESLTKKEMCNLHFMLSYSIDPYKRRDERCSPLFGESKRNDVPHRRSDWDVSDYYMRHRRHIDHGDGLNGMKTKSREMGFSGKHKRQEMLKKIEKRAAVLERERRNPEIDRNLEVEEIPVLASAPGAFHEEKDKFTIGAQDLLSDGESHGQTGLRYFVQAKNFGIHGGKPFGGPAHATDDGTAYGIIPDIPLSDCPVVNGVINTPFGSLTIGTVITGIAAGLNPEEIPPTRLSVDQSELESPSDRVKNLWATTLAGTVADTLSSPAIMNAESLQILKGGWNDSAEPRWYLLSNNDFKHLPEVALRGSLDGYLLGMNVKEWTNKFPEFKLSQILRSYYEFVWGGVGAKNRVQIAPKYAPEELFRKQAFLMSLVLKKQKTQVLTVLNYRPIVQQGVRKVVEHIHTMDSKEMDKSYIGSFMTTGIDNSISTIAVIDSSWGHEELLKIFRVLKDAQVACTVGNKLTIVCGKDGKVLVSSENIADLYSVLTKDMLIGNCSRGMELPLVFDKVDAMYRRIFHEEKTSNKMITASQVFVIFPYEPLLQESSYVIERSKNFRQTFPDVRLMVAASGRADSFLPLVKNPNDVFSVASSSSDPERKTVKEFANGLKQSFHRFSRPSCGSYFDDDTQGSEIQVVRDVLPGSVAYYRLQPQYFYTQEGLVTVSIRSKLGAPLTVCHSREVERPKGPTPRGDAGDYPPSRIPDHIPDRRPGYDPNRSPGYRPDFPPEASPYERQTEEHGQVTCKTITTEPHKIEMNNPCQGSDLQHCQPLYISLSSPLQDTISIICPNCRLPMCVQYEVKLLGLTCYNSAAVKLVSPILFLLLLIRYIFTE